MSRMGRVRQALAVAWMLAVREWMAELRQSRLSPLWPLLQPLAYTALFVMLRPLLGGPQSGGPLLFGVFVFIGFSLWQGWFEALRSQMDALRRHKGLMSRGELGFATLVAATFMASLFALVPRLLLAIIVVVVIADAGATAVLQLVVFALLTLLNGAVIGALLQPFATLSPDLGKTVQSFSLALMVTGAVFIPFPENPPSVVIGLLDANPMGTLLQAARGGVFGQHPGGTTPVGAWTVATLALVALLPAFGRRTLPIVVERLGN